MNLPPPQCSVIIPVFNQLAYTKDCLASLYCEPAGKTFEVIVVDNGSTDGSAEFLSGQQSRRDNLRYIRFQSNLGYSRANNEAAQAATGHYLVFLNNDTIATPNWLAPLVEVAARPGVGAVGAKLIYPGSERINHAGYAYNAELRRFYLIYELQKPFLPAVNREREFQAVLGACMLVPREVFFRAGMFSDYGLEDIDLCLKIRELGLKVIYTPQSVLYHYGSITLRNSEAGSLPVASTEQFNARWPAEKLKWDDKDYYEQDGYGYAYTNDGRVVVLHKDGRVLALDQDDAQPVTRRNLAELEEAARANPADLAPQLDLVLQLLEEGSIDDAMQKLEKVTADFPQYLEGRMLFAELLARVGNFARAQMVAKNILESKDLQPELAVRARVIIEK